MAVILLQKALLKDLEGSDVNTRVRQDTQLQGQLWSSVAGYTFSV